MPPAPTRRATSKPLIAIAMTVLLAAAAADRCVAEDFEVHEWSLWVFDPLRDTVNANQQNGRALPRFVGTERRPPTKQGRNDPTPVSVMTFRGDPVKAADVRLSLSNGVCLAHWPVSTRKPRRIGWDSISLTAEPVDSARIVYTGKSHWYSAARDLPGALFVNHRSRCERFLAYDLEFKMPEPIKVDGGPDRYRITSSSAIAIEDLLIVAPGPEGHRIGWLDRLPQPENAAGPAAPPTVEITMSEPVAAGSRMLQEAQDRLRKGIVGAGLTEEEASLMLSIASKSIVESEDMVAVLRLPSSTADTLFPLEIEPKPSKIVRVPLLLMRNIDPQYKNQLDALIAGLGADAYTEREEAEKRLIKLGPIAVPHLKKAIKNTDAEIAFRAERILLDLREPITGN